MQQYAGAAFWPANGASGAAREREHIETLARRLYVLAWVIEGVAVALGLGMALSLNLPGESTFAEFLLGGGGFVMVACAELSKIPLATFFVETPRRRAKLFTLGFLLLMSFITFETIFMSLERGFNVRLQSVHAHKERVAELRAEHGRLSASVEDPSVDLRSRRAAIDKQLAENDKALKSEQEAQRNRREELLRELQQSKLPEELRRRLEAVETSQRGLIEERDRKIADAEDRARRDREYLKKQLADARKKADAAQEAEVAEKLKRLNPRAEASRIERTYQRKIDDLNAQEKALRDEREKLLRAAEAEIKPRLDAVAVADNRINAEFAAKREDLRRQLTDLHRQEAGLLEKVGESARQRDALTNQIRTKETELRRVASDSQLHRIAPPFARWWTGEHYDPHTIPDTYVKTVAVVWFGSMAMLGALGGSVVAMVSQLLRKRASRLGLPAEAPAPDPAVVAAKQKFWTSLRRMLVKRKFRRVRTRTVEVVKVETQTKFVAVPIPSNGSIHDFKREFAELSASLSPSAATDKSASEQKKPTAEKQGPTNEPTGNV